jgi:rare lipoprotein A
MGILNFVGITQGLSPVILILVCLLLSACAPHLAHDGAPEQTPDVSSIPDAVPREEPRSPYGNPEFYDVLGKRYYVIASSRGYIESGIASWYGTKFHGQRTSSGETYDMNAMTAAHKTLPLPTYVEVTNLENRKTVVVKVNDRGPFHENRIIDLSYAAAIKLGITARGTGLVEVRAIDPAHYVGSNKQAPVEPATRVADNSLRFFIQVGAFADLMKAENLRDRLAVLGSSLVNISKAEISGKTLYRVRIGPLDSIEYADQIVTKLGGIGVVEHQVIID